MNIFERKAYSRILGLIYDNEKENWRMLTNKERKRNLKFNILTCIITQKITNVITIKIYTLFNCMDHVHGFSLSISYCIYIKNIWHCISDLFSSSENMK